MSVKILGTGSFLPEKSVSNDDLSKVMDTSDEWISSRTGIRSRHISIEDTTSTMAVKAAEKALEVAGISAEELDHIFVATLSGDYATPSTACQVQKGIGAVNAVCMDINAACSGFVFGLNTAVAYARAGMGKKMMIIGVETLSKILDWSDRSTCVLFGDGAGAAVVEYDDSIEHSFYLNSSGDEQGALKTTKLSVNNPLHQEEIEPIHFYMNGQQVFKFAVTAIKETLTTLLTQNNLSLDDINLVIPHQANKRIIDKVVKDLKASSKQFFLNVSDYGNTSAASIPIALNDAITKQQIKNGDQIKLIGFGGGLTWGGCIVSI